MCREWNNVGRKKDLFGSYTKKKEIIGFLRSEGRMKNGEKGNPKPIFESVKQSEGRWIKGGRLIRVINDLM